MQLQFDVVDLQPKARHTDPDTSHAAAASIKAREITQLQLFIRTILGALACEDDELVRKVQGWSSSSKHYAPSGIRTRRAELVKMGVVESVGKVLKSSGRWAYLWKIKKEEVK